MKTRLRDYVHREDIEFYDFAIANIGYDVLIVRKPLNEIGSFGYETFFYAISRYCSENELSQFIQSLKLGADNLIELRKSSPMTAEDLIEIKKLIIRKGSNDENDFK